MLSLLRRVSPFGGSRESEYVKRGRFLKINKLYNLRNLYWLFKFRKSFLEYN